MAASAEITPIPNGTVTSAQGFSAGGVFIGLKTRGEDKLDLAMLVSDSECSIGGVFTTSAIRSATVDLDRERVARGRGRALIVNAGIANTCVGAQGYKDAEEMTRLAAEKLGLTAEDVLVCSTGVIGVELPMSLIRSGVTEISLDANGGPELARAMMTTDTHPKETAVSFVASTGQTITVGGVAKGSGMIHPNMATMLTFATTDAAVDPGFLQMTVKAVADETFNMLTVDGDSSTNDTYLAFAQRAGGQSGDRRAFARCGQPAGRAAPGGGQPDSDAGEGRRGGDAADHRAGGRGAACCRRAAGGQDHCRKQPGEVRRVWR